MNPKTRNLIQYSIFAIIFFVICKFLYCSITTKNTDNIIASVSLLVAGLIIPFVGWEMTPWLKGLTISFISAILVMIIVYPKDKKTIIPMFVFSLILGAGIGVAGAKFIG